MKKLISVIVGICFCLLSHAFSTGTWKAYLAYHDITEIQQAGSSIYVLASNNLYSYNQNDQSILTYDKTKTLSDCHITHIAYCSSAKRLVITYNNYNIDLLDNQGNVTNIPDYYQKSMSDDKTIYDIYVHGNNAYLSTGFGIIRINVKDAEISDTYQLGAKVAYTYISDNYIYAAEPNNGIFKASMDDNLLDKSNWTREKDYVAQNKTIDPTLLSFVQSLQPGGPQYNYFYQLKYKNDCLYTAGGQYNASVESDRPGTVQVLKNGEWALYEDQLTPKTGVKYRDIDCIDVDPTETSHVFVSGKCGLYEFREGKYQNIYTLDNSPLGTALNESQTNKRDYVLVEGIAFDDKGNLWCLNSQSKTGSLFEYTADKEWKRINIDIPLLNAERSLGALQSPFFDSRNLLWFVNDHWTTPGLFCYQPSTNGFQSYTTFVNEDGTTVSPTYVRCVTEDMSHHIWIGTNVGPLVLENTEINNNESTFTQVKVPRNDGTNYADYLLANIDITSIAIDGGGRKWMGTNGNGVYLISEDNMTQIHHFTRSDSPLLSDNILSIAINGKTGEVFFATEEGLCSYQSDATEAQEKMTKDNVYAYPNPVRPDYTGLITIVGLSYNADVKIVTSNGILVNEGTSNGGTYTWNGCDQNGRKVASGVYMVETATNSGSKGTVCKIAIVR